jgi:Tfp pilus assembly protein PilF
MTARALLLATLLVTLPGCSTQPLRELIQPSKGAAALATGLRQYDDGDYAEAARNLQAAVDLGLSDSDRANAHKHLAFIHCASARERACREEFRKALSGDPTSAAAHRGLAEIERRRGKLDNAIKELQSSLQARDSAVVRTLLARVYLEQKKPDLARTEVQRALKLAPNYSEAKELLQHLQNGKPSGGAQ